MYRSAIMNRYLRSAIVLSLLSGGAFVHTAHAELKNLPEKMQKISSPNGSTAVVKGEFIVKFTNNLTQNAEELLQKKQSFRSAMANGDDSLDRLNKKVGVRAARHLLKGMAKGKNHRQIQSHLIDNWKDVKAKFAKRAKRAPKDAVMPDMSNVYVMSVSEEADVEDICKMYQADPNVVYCQPNYQVQANFTPNDPYFSSTGSWGQTYDDLWGLKKMNMPAAWDLTKGAGMVVAVVDTGLDTTHPDIVANLWDNPQEIPNNGIDDDANGYIDDKNGWNFINQTKNVTDRFGHGTHVSGTIAATANNSVGIAGVAPEAKIMPLKGLDDNGSGTIEGLAQAIVYAANNGADVINNSWSCSSACPINPVVEDAVRTAHDLGAVVVFSAGNSSGRVEQFSPQNFPYSVVVASSDHLDNKSNFSNYGDCIDVAAPGSGNNLAPPAASPDRNILSLKSSVCNVAMCPPELIVGGQYLRQAGTSMAAPHVSGLAALIVSLHPDFSVEQVRQVLRQSAKDIWLPGFDTYFGYGRIDALGSLQINTLPLEALITAPSQISNGINQIQIKGTAAGVEFQKYVLEWGAGDNPSSWTNIATSFSEVRDGILGNLDIRSVPDAVLVLRLRVNSVSGKIYEDRQGITLDRVILDSPPLREPTPIRVGSDVVMTGTVNPGLFSKYTMSVLDTKARVFLPVQFNIPNGGLAPVVQGVIGTWNTAGVPAGRYQLQLTVELTNGQLIKESSPIIIVDTKPAWPKKIPVHDLGAGWILSLRDPLVSADINQDGKSEILIAYGPKVQILNDKGENIPGWPQMVDSGLGQLVYIPPAVADLDGDGKPEIVAGNSQGQVFIWRANGTPYPGWPKTFGTAANSIAIDDVDGNGIPDLILKQVSTLNAVNLNGTSLPGWPVAVTTYFGEQPLVADLDRDGKKEIVVMDQYAPSNLFVFNNHGQILPGWPKQINPGMSSRANQSYPAIGNIDGDGDLEIVVGSLKGNLYAFHHDGTNVAGWPKSLTADITTSVNTPIIADLDKNGSNEITVGTSYDSIKKGESLFIFRGDGTTLPGWPKTINSAGGYGILSPVIADIDNDGIAEIITECDRYDFLEAYNSASIQAFHMNGSLAAGFPKAVAGSTPSFAAMPLVTDMDGDNLLELVWIDFELISFNKFYIYVWGLPGAASSYKPWPMFLQNARHTGIASPTITVTATDAVAAEPSDNGIFMITRDGATTAPLTVNFSISGTASATDYAAIGTSATIPAGSSSTTINVNVTADAMVESAETVILTLSPNANYTFGFPKTATITIEASGVSTLSASAASVAAGEVSTVSWNNITSPTPADWIGLFANGAADTGFSKWVYVSCDQNATVARVAGSCAFTIPVSVPAGQYEFRLFSNNGYTKLATSVAFTVTPPLPATLSASPASINAGDSSAVSWNSIANPTPMDWIGLFASGAADANYSKWVYVSCSQTAATAQAAGSCMFTIPPATAPGQYEFRLFANNGSTKLATSASITVAPAATLSVFPPIRNVGNTTTVFWSNIASPVPMDWIGLFAKGAADADYSKWIYVSCSQNATTAKATGSCAFTIPSSMVPGLYEFRLFANNGSRKLATSGTLTIAPVFLSASPATINAGGISTVSWENIITPLSRDWIGLFATGAADADYSQWIYVSCSQTATISKGAGSCAFTIPSTTTPGQYEFRLFANNGSVKLSTSNSVTVNSP